MLDLADIGPIASALAVLVAVTFGSLTLYQWRRTRFLASAAELVHIIQMPEFTRSIGLIMELPEAAEPNRIRLSPELVTAVYSVSHMFESLGVLVYHRLLPLSLVDDLIGGYVRSSWRRVRPYVESRRGELGISLCEWYQWLAERIEAYPAPGKAAGAHVTHRDWKP